MKKNKIFIACDTSNINQIKKIIKFTKPYNLIPKFGLQFFYSKNGRKFLEILAFWIFDENIPNPLSSTLSPLLRVFFISFRIILENFSKSFFKKFG